MPNSVVCMLSQCSSFGSQSLGWQMITLLLLALTSWVFAARLRKPANFSVQAPVVGRRWPYEPKLLVGLRFFSDSITVVTEGYRKYGDDMFKIWRNDGELLVISNKHVDQIRSLPEEEVSGMAAHVKNIAGRYTNTTILQEGDLHTRVIQQMLTPHLSSILPRMKEELDYALDAEVPDCSDQWVRVSIHDIIVRVVARVSARVFLGPEICRKEEWLSTSIHFTENVYEVIITLRMLPSFLHPVIAPLLPAYWRVLRDISTAKRIICPIVEKRLRGMQELGDLFDKPDDLLQWMLDIGNADELKPEKLAHRHLMLSLAGIHTSSMSTAHAIYDLCANPEYFEPLREELSSVLAESGGWKKAIIPKFRKLDSFLKESQRVNPPSLLAFNRIVQVPIELSDGTKLPPGTHFCMAAEAIGNDPANLPGGYPTFDPFRWARLREDPTQPENFHRYQFGTTSNSSLHFGHGKFACPGRFFAGQQIKMILGHLLLRYDFQYPAGQARPRNLCSDENIYPDPMAKILIKRRDKVIS